MVSQVQKTKDEWYLEKEGEGETGRQEREGKYREAKRKKGKK